MHRDSQVDASNTHKFVWRQRCEKGDKKNGENQPVEPAVV